MPGEVFQSIGARALFIYALEASWGVVNGSPNWRRMRMVPGESMERNVAMYKSREMRSDRMHNETVFGTQDPGGGIPFELSPQGWNPLFYHLLGGSDTLGNGGSPVTGVAPPATPTVVPSTTGGTIPAGTTYQYKITCITAAGETLPSTASVAATTTGTTSKITVTWTAVTGAIGYRIYGRTSAALGANTAVFIATVGPGTGTGSINYVDTGANTPVGPAPTSDTSGSAWIHQLYGSVGLPVGFTVEKGFLDQPLFIPYYGCRINSLTLNCNINQFVTGAWSIMAQQEGDSSAISLNSGGTPTLPTDKPYTATQVAVYKDNSNGTLGSTLLGKCRDLTLSINNAFQGQRGFVLGSTLRQNLKPGDRLTTTTGKFFFTDDELYREAILGSSNLLRVTFSNGVYSAQFDFPNFKLLPSRGATPKATDENQLEIDMTGEANPGVIDAVTTDVKLTLSVPEASIIT